MKVFDIQNEDGERSSFEVSNLLLSRREAARVIDRIPGVTITRPVRRLFSSKPDLDEFCVFRLGKVVFTLEEPWGDNSRYWISSRPSGSTAEFELVREAFRQWSLIRSPFALLRVAGLVLVLASIAWIVVK